MSIGEPINQSTTKLNSLELVGGSYCLGKMYCMGSGVCSRIVSPCPHAHSTRESFLLMWVGEEETPFFHFDHSHAETNVSHSSIFTPHAQVVEVVSHAENWESCLTFTIWLWVNFIFGDFSVCVFLPHVNSHSSLSSS